MKKHQTSPTTFSFGSRFSHAVNAITSFSEAPLRLIFVVGMTIFLLSMLYALELVLERLLYAEVVDGWTSVMASIWVLGGLVLSFLGDIRVCLPRIFSETKQPPYTIDRGIHGHSRSDAGGARHEH